ncbi:MAG: hypothetical protein J6D03_02695 [Clostridia bacterium]|nr:hypothetical protein [Clostridia bacterium]
MNEEVKINIKLIIVFVLVIGLLVSVQILMKNKGKKENKIIQNSIQESLIINMNDNYYNVINTEKELNQYFKEQNNTRYYTIDEYKKIQNKD